jgi:hypothetical protein
MIGLGPLGRALTSIPSWQLHGKRSPAIAAIRRSRQDNASGPEHW